MIIIRILINLLMFNIEITLIFRDKKNIYRINAQGDTLLNIDYINV